MTNDNFKRLVMMGINTKKITDGDKNTILATYLQKYSSGQFKGKATKLIDDAIKDASKLELRYKSRGKK